jgi:hypothetical protein
LGIRPARAEDGAFADGGELMRSACARCGYRGQALEFPRREDHARFVGELHAAP